MIHINDILGNDVSYGYSREEPKKRTPILIVGGSLVGLLTSLFLSWHGIPSILVEPHPTTSIHPSCWL